MTISVLNKEVKTDQAKVRLYLISATTDKRINNKIVVHLEQIPRVRNIPKQRRVNTCLEIREKFQTCI